MILFANVKSDIENKQHWKIKNMEELVLVKVDEEYASQIADYRQEMLDMGSSMDGTGSLKVMENPYDYIAKCRDYEKKETLPEGRVIATQFLFVRKSDNKIVGMIQVRHYFNEYLEKYSGHIGYSVRPSERKKGYAKTMLKMALPFCNSIGLDKVLITCDEDNEGSERTIRANGGEFESIIFEPNEGINFKRFWVKTNQAN